MFKKSMDHGHSVRRKRGQVSVPNEKQLQTAGRVAFPTTRCLRPGVVGS